MKRLGVWIGIEGVQTYVDICGEGVEDSCFSYAKEYYMDSKHKPISIHLPFSDESFSPDDTRNFFEGLQPEGFTRRCVAGWMLAKLLSNCFVSVHRFINSRKGNDICRNR